jgi:spore coat protein U-like protein
MKKELNKTKSVFVKKSKMSLAKSTTALTCLIGSLIIVSSEPVIGVTTTGSMEVTGSVSSVCTVVGSTMPFTAFSGSDLSATSTITANCTAGTTFTISLATTPDSGSTYNLIKTGITSGAEDLATNQLGVIFKNAGGTTLTNGVAALSQTGTGSSAPVGTITGTIIASANTGKAAGSYAKTMTLNIVY